MEQKPGGASCAPAPRKERVTALANVCAVKMENITKRFGKVTANKDVTLELYKGEILSLLGENGSGKTTLMNMLSGIYFPDEGQIYIDGQPVTIASPKDAFALGIGMIHQHFKLVDLFTATENIILGLEGKLDIAEASKKVKEICDKYGFDIDPNQKIYDMSVSQKQTVEIVKVLYRGADILILDEPTVGLDPAQMIEIRSLIRDLGKTHTVILSSHILSEVQSVCDRVLIIAHGRLVAQGTPEELAARLTAKGTITATAQGSREEILAAAGTVPGLTNLTVTEEKDGEVSLTAVSTEGTDLRGALSQALAGAGCPVLDLRAETMSLEDVFLQLTETPQTPQQDHTKEGDEQ